MLSPTTSPPFVSTTALRIKGEIKFINDRSGHFMNRSMSAAERASVQAETEAAFAREGADSAGKFQFWIQRPRNQ